jgi:N-acyl-D-aspartate/D-glutamate deacylase
MFDVKIINGTIVDGTGDKPYSANVGVKNGTIVEIGNCDGEATKTIDASGAIVTPGFVDLHTHYDGQISWDDAMQPSVNHGVTTAIMGSCGVGFAPAREKDRDLLIRLMEGVEDIPGVALAEGLTWDWESFPEYMNAIDKLPHSIDFAVQVPHDPLRVYVMGERATYDNPANDADIAEMRRLTREALQAGAVGFTTGRSDVHRSADGDWTPGSEATVDELCGIAEAFDGLDHGVLQLVNDFNIEKDGDHFDAEFDLVEAYAKAGGSHPTSISLMQRDFEPNQWKRIIKRAEEAKEKGIVIRLQVAPRAIGVMIGLQCTFHPFMGFPSYKAIATLPLAERVAAMKQPDFKARLLSEKSEKLAGDGSSVPPLVDTFLNAIDMVACKIFELGESPNYEQSIDNSLYKHAQKQGVSTLEAIYDALLKDDGKALLYFPIYNYTEFNYDNVREMMGHPLALMGLSDGGAHVGTVCDASFPTYLLSYWTKGRKKGGHITIERAVQMLTQDTAHYVGMHDRGTLEVGKKADINVIDIDKLSLKQPRMVQDLPAGGQRLLQDAVGYRATLVSGVPVVENDILNAARPGRLVRMGQ